MIVTEADGADPVAQGLLNGCHVVRAPPSPQELLVGEHHGLLEYSSTAPLCIAAWAATGNSRGPAGFDSWSLLAEDGLNEVGSQRANGLMWPGQQ